MRNPLKRQPSADPKPTLRERAAALKATAGRVMHLPKSLPPPGSEAAREAFEEACREHARETQFAHEDYPDLKRTSLEWWTKASLSRARELGEISAAECARLYPRASEREMRIDAVSHRLNVGALHALAYANDPPMPPEGETEDACAEHAQEPDEAGHQPAALATPASLSIVEAGLTALVAEYEEFARVSDEAMILEDEAELPRPEDLKNAIERVRIFTSHGRQDAIRHAMALPATTLLAFGLKAKILEHDTAGLWGECGGDADAARCLAFLQGLIAAAGLSPIPRAEVTPDEIRGWLAKPKTAPGASRVKA